MASKFILKITSAALVIVMMLAMFAACAETQDGSGETTLAPETQAPSAATTVAETEPEETIVGDDVPELDFKGEEIIILGRNRDWVADEIIVSDENGTVVNDAVYKRNSLVTERLGINLTFQGVGSTNTTDNYAVRDALRKFIESGEEDIDLVSNAAYVAASTQAEGLYRNLTDVENLDLSKPYWSQGLNTAMEAGGAQYLCSGAIFLSYYRFIFATFFNVDMFNNAGIELLYDTVEKGEWTLEKQFTLAEQLYKDNNGNGETDEGDFFGFMGNHDMIGVDGYWASFELPILTKDEEGYYKYALDLERTGKAVSLINDFFWNNKGVMRVAHKSGDTEQDDIAQSFANEEAAMVTLRLYECENDLVGMSNYGIVPLPKLDGNQEINRSAIHDSFSVYSLPNFSFTDDELSMLGAVLEVMASQSFKTITPAYYEQALKGRYVNDPQSVAMLDDITQNVWIEAGILNCNAIEAPHKTFRDAIKNQYPNASSLFSQKAKITQRKIKDLNEALEKLLG